MPSNNRKRESSSEGKESKTVIDQQTSEVHRELEPQTEAEAVVDEARRDETPAPQAASAGATRPQADAHPST